MRYFGLLVLVFLVLRSCSSVADPANPDYLETSVEEQSCSTTSRRVLGEDGPAAGAVQPLSTGAAPTIAHGRPDHELATASEPKPRVLGAPSPGGGGCAADDDLEGVGSCDADTQAAVGRRLHAAPGGAASAGAEQPGSGASGAAQAAGPAGTPSPECAQEAAQNPKGAQAAAASNAQSETGGALEGAAAAPAPGGEGALPATSASAGGGAPPAEGAGAATAEVAAGDAQPSQGGASTPGASAAAAPEVVAPPPATAAARAPAPPPEPRKRTALPSLDDFDRAITPGDLSTAALSGSSEQEPALTLEAALEGVQQQALHDGLAAVLGAVDAAAGILAGGAGGPAAAGHAAGAGAGGGDAGHGSYDYDEDDGRKINLAASSDGATIVAANREARRPERMIDGDDDSYMKNVCVANKWVIVELSQLARVDEVQLTMKEMYSSRVRDFVVKGRPVHPKKDGFADYAKGLDLDTWQVLGSFRAENKKGSQTFQLPVRTRVRYLLLQFLSHYGNEEVCALNSMVVRGVTAAQELEAALARAESQAQQQQQQPPPQQQQQQQQPPPQQQQPVVLPPAAPTAAPDAVIGLPGGPQPAAAGPGASSSLTGDTAAAAASGEAAGRPPNGGPAEQQPQADPAGSGAAHAEARGDAVGPANTAAVAAPGTAPTHAPAPSPTHAAGFAEVPPGPACGDEDAGGQQGKGGSGDARMGGAGAGSGQSEPPAEAAVAAAQVQPQQQAQPPAPPTPAQPAPAQPAASAAAPGSAVSAKAAAAAERTHASPQPAPPDAAVIKGGAAGGTTLGSPSVAPAAGLAPPAANAPSGAAVAPALQEAAQGIGQHGKEAVPETAGVQGTPPKAADGPGLSLQPKPINREPDAVAAAVHKPGACAAREPSANDGAGGSGSAGGAQPHGAGGVPDPTPAAAAAPAATPVPAPPGKPEPGPGMVAAGVPPQLASDAAHAAATASLPSKVAPTAAQHDTKESGDSSVGAPAGGTLPPAATAAGTAAPQVPAKEAAAGGAGRPAPGDVAAATATAATEVKASAPDKGAASSAQPSAATPATPPLATPAAGGSSGVATSSTGAAKGGATTGSSGATKASNGAQQTGAPPPPTQPKTQQAPHAAAASTNGVGAGGSSATVLAPDLWSSALMSPNGLPALEPVSLLIEGGSASKPRVAGNLFDIIKQEMMLMKLNQSRLWGYMQHLVEALNARHAELAEDTESLVERLAAMEGQVAAVPQRTARAVREAQDGALLALLGRVEQLEAELKASKAQSTAVLLYGAAALGAAGAAAMAGRQYRGLRRLVLALSVCNGAVGVWLNLSLMYPFLLGVRMLYHEAVAVAVSQAVRWLPLSRHS